MYGDYNNAGKRLARGATTPVSPVAPPVFGRTTPRSGRSGYQNLPYRVPGLVNVGPRPMPSAGVPAPMPALRRVGFDPTGAAAQMGRIAGLGGNMNMADAAQADALMRLLRRAASLRMF